MYASLCAPRALGRWRWRGRDRRKQISSNKSVGRSGTPLPTQVSPSSPSSPLPPVCLTALAYGHECQCSSRKHDLGWNNPFGKGLSAYLRPFSSFSFSLLSLSVCRLIFFVFTSRSSNDSSCSRPLLPRVHRVREIEFNLKFGSSLGL